ncbi:MAG: DUF3858 domain-containing protein [Flavobacteriaceae bacterium]
MYQSKITIWSNRSTDDRKVLIVSPKGGKLVHTNKYDVRTKYQKITGKYNISSKGAINADIEISNSGKLYNKKYYLEFEKNEDQVIYYKNQFSNLLDVDILKINFVNDKESIIFKESISLKASNYAEVLNNEMMLKLNAFNTFNHLPKRYSNRIHPIEITNGFKDEDEIIITIPKNYRINQLPDAIKLENEFGEYSFQVEKINAYELRYKRTLILFETTHSKNVYSKFRSFLTKINKNDKQKIILSKI